MKKTGTAATPRKQNAHATDARAARSEQTRARLIAIAERLFARRGIEAVSLNDINKAAGQRNKNATHYHFGSKKGLLQALIDKHQPVVEQRQQKLLDEVESGGAVTLRQVVHAMVRPLVDKLADPDGGSDYLRINAQLVVAHAMTAMKLRESPARAHPTERLQARLRSLMPGLPEALMQQRGILVAVLMMQGLAELARMLDADGAPNPLADPARYAANLEDCITAMLAAAPSAETLATLVGGGDATK